MGIQCDCYCNCSEDASSEFDGGDGLLCFDCIDGLHEPEDFDYDEKDEDE